jgi:DNA-binding beta-propeller fold protein YncE
MAVPRFIRSWGIQGNQPGQFNNPAGLAYHPLGHLYVADRFNNRLQIFETDGTPLGPPIGGFQLPFGIAVDANLVYITNGFPGPNQLMSLPLAGGVPVPWATTGAYPGAAATDGQGNVFVTLPIPPLPNVPPFPRLPIRVQVFNSGKLVGAWGPSGSAPGQLSAPVGIAYFQGHLYVADTENNRVQVFTPQGRFVRGWGTLGQGNGQLAGPSGIAVDPVKNLVYVLDTGNRRVQVFTPQGVFQGVFNGIVPLPQNVIQLVGIALSPDAFFVTNSSSVQSYTLF